MNTISKFSLFIFTALSVLSASAFAQSSYYDILANEFKSTKQKLTLNDIDRPGHPQARVCIEIDREHPQTERFVLIGLYTRIKNGQGPLLPQVVTSKIIYYPYGADIFAENIFDSVSTQAYSTELRSVRSLGSEKIWNLVVKKKDDLLLFARDEGGKRHYGYCFYR